MYQNLIEAGWSFNDIDQADYYGLINYLGNDKEIMSGADFFKMI
jgi:hypothetical protein